MNSICSRGVVIMIPHVCTLQALIASHVFVGQQNKGWLL
jgi:hypothetical protein